MSFEIESTASARELLEVDRAHSRSHWCLGQGVNIVQIEREYLNHPSVKPEEIPFYERNESLDYKHVRLAIHATAVASICCSMDHGVAREARHLFCRIKPKPIKESDVFSEESYDLGPSLDYLFSNAQNLGLKRGDIVFTSSQIRSKRTNNDFLPIDADLTIARSLQALTNQLGLICVIAAGNANRDLDEFEVLEYKDIRRSYRQHYANRSGAIRVGYTTHDMESHENSNHGECVQMFANAESVRAACYDYSITDLTSDLLHTYTRGFGRTSAATPAVAGALACIQSQYRRHNQDRSLTASQMVELVQQTGIRPNPSIEKDLGLKPDIDAAVTEILKGWTPTTR